MPKMDQNKAFSLQRQVMQNTEDLQKEFLDMQAWEEQMKKKDFEIRSSKTDKPLPPVRTKRKKIELVTPTESKNNDPAKTERIKSGDYKSWDKFDVEAACDAIEGELGLRNQKSKLEFEIPSEQVLEKEHEEANKFKDEGNALVKEKEYAKAVGKYSQAIKIFPGDAAFYVNRALCQFKLDNLYSAEADCNEAIKLNCQYVKAYYRRATTRVELKNYEAAKKDLEKILELEPENKEAKNLLAQVEKKIEKLPKPLIISGNETDDKSSIEKKIGEKLFPKKSEKSQSKDSDEKKSDNSKQTGSSQDEDIISIDVKMNPKTDIYLETMKKLEEEKSKQKDDNNGLPSWLPKLKEGLNFVETSTQNSSRKKQTLRRIPIIEEIPSNESIFKEIQEIEEVKLENPSDVVKIVPALDNSSKIKTEKINTDMKNKEPETIPPPPKSSVTFLITWRKNTSPDFRYKFLKQISPKNIPDIFKESMESDIFSDILFILNTKFIPNENKVFDFMLYLSKLKRFKALVLFMSSADKEAIKSIFKYCRTKEGKGDEVKVLESAFEL